MTLLRGLAVAFWLFCVVSCCVFLYNDYFPPPDETQAAPSQSGGGACPMGYTSGEPPPNHPVVNQEKPKPKGESCPLGFGGRCCPPLLCP